MLPVWTNDEVLAWLADNNLASLVPVFRLHKIDGRELDRIREKNDSKVLISDFFLFTMFFFENFLIKKFFFFTMFFF